jgi:hypothetical protein
MTYNSREEAVASVAEDDQRVQYDGKDFGRIEAISGTFTHHAVELIASLGAYALTTKAEEPGDAEEAKDQAAETAYARRELIEQWALTQLALSKIAWALRVDGNAAYDRLIAALNIEGGTIDMRGL